jgi:hypothetical protein
VEDIDIVCAPLIIELFQKGIRSNWPAHGRAADLDTHYYLPEDDVPTADISIHGELFGLGLPNPVQTITLTLLGGFIGGETIVCDPLEITVTLRPAAFETTGGQCNWVKWSKIGYLNFTIDESNEAGERPLDWSGCVYELLKLGDTIVAYGTNGVTVLKPASVNWGMKTIYRVGAKCKTAIAGTENDHYFIDQKDRLVRITGENITILDYSEFLSNLTNPRLTLDIELGLLYICDGTYGYVYSTRFNSFGEGPINVTGMGTKSGTLYVVAPEEILNRKFHLCTDIYDLGNRKPKTIQWIEFGTDLTDKLHAMVETRISNKDPFKESNWALVNPSGIAYIPCYGVEFKFHLKSRIYEYIELDYIRVFGAQHGFSYLDSIDNYYRGKGE